MAGMAVTAAYYAAFSHLELFFFSFARFAARTASARPHRDALPRGCQ
jgi:hypothetical protein